MFTRENSVRFLSKLQNLQQLTIYTLQFDLEYVKQDCSYQGEALDDTNAS